MLWEQQVRIRHMITRKYLKVNKEGKIQLESSNADPLTVFRLHSVIRERDEIEYETYCRIEHVVTGKWISTSQGTCPSVILGLWVLNIKCVTTCTYMFDIMSILVLLGVVSSLNFLSLRRLHIEWCVTGRG